MSQPAYWQRAVLMGDPAHFSVQGGANPHTRTRWGTRRSVDRTRAIEQWNRLRDLLTDLGIRVVVVPPDPSHPGLVYPANAGFQTDLDAELPLAQKTFYLANLLPTRAGERAHYARVLSTLGLRVATIEDGIRFEGEADFFPTGDRHLLTHGQIEKQRFVPAFAFPPWRRVYGFRTDARVEPLLARIIAPRPITRLELTREAHYHGDTAISAFGPQRRHLLVYREALSATAWDRLVEAVGAEAILPLVCEDAARYAANSFSFTRGSDSFLVLPGGISERLQAQVRERGVTPVVVDVSEFLKKGGGSVKCMIGDLGPLPGPDVAGSPRDRASFGN
jgi:N-dimethylarginine dimethylaminohydrolase